MNQSKQKLITSFKYIMVCFVVICTISSSIPSTYAAIGSLNTRDSAVSAPYTVLAPLPCIPTPARTETDASGKTVTIPAANCPNGDLQNVSQVSFQTYVQNMINLLIAVAAVAAVFMIVYGGFEYMTSEAWTGKGDGLKKIQNAIWGLLLVLSSYIILRTIDPRLVNVPTSLVPQIILSNSNLTKSNQNFFDQLAKDAETYKVQSQDLGNQNKQAHDQVTSLQTKIDNIDEELALNPDLTDADKNQLLAQRQDFLNQQNATMADAEVTNVTQYMNAQLSTVATKNQEAAKSNDLGLEMQNIDQAIKSVNDYSVKGENKLYGMDEPGKIESIEAQKNYSLAVLSADAAGVMIASLRETYRGGQGGQDNYTFISSASDGGSVGEVTMNSQTTNAKIQATIDQAQTNLASVTDPALKAQVQAKIDTAKASLNAKIGASVNKDASLTR